MGENTVDWALVLGLVLMLVGGYLVYEAFTRPITPQEIYRRSRWSRDLGLIGGSLLFGSGFFLVLFVSDSTGELIAKVREKVRERVRLGDCDLCGKRLGPRPIHCSCGAVFCSTPCYLYHRRDAHKD